MSKVRVTLTSKPGVIPIGAAITLRKQPLNEYDDEAIEVTLDSFLVGYVSAHYRTRKPGTISAGRIYDRFENVITAKVVADQVAEVEVENE